MMGYTTIKPYRLLELNYSFPAPCTLTTASHHAQQDCLKNYKPTGAFFSNTDENSYDETLQVHKYYYLKHKQTLWHFFINSFTMISKSLHIKKAVTNHTECILAWDKALQSRLHHQLLHSNNVICSTACR
jgi:hypothetical protein